MAVVAPLVKAMYDRLHSSMWEEIGLTVSVSEELDRLRGALSSITASLASSDQKAGDGAMAQRWLCDLKEVLYDADDVLDEYEYEVLRSKLVSMEPAGFGRVRVSLPSLSLQAVDNNFQNQISEKVKRVRRHLEDSAFKLPKRHGGDSAVNESADSLESWVEFAGEDLRSGGEDIEKQITHFFSSSDDQSPRPSQENMSLSTILGTGALAKGQPVLCRTGSAGSALSGKTPVGRKADLEALVALLVDGDACVDRNPVNVVSIVGVGGVGKTTLARLLFNDSRVAKNFQLMLWACVSADFDVRRLIVEILEAASVRKHDLVDFTALQDRLQETLRGKKFLLVLDDVWNEDSSLWQKLRRPLLAGDRGSVVLVTTRSVGVAEVTSTIPPYFLKCLTNEDCWRVLEQNAFAEEDPRRHPELVMIGKGIAAKMNGLPLAAKTLGAILRAKQDESSWKEILESEVWDLKQGDDAILPVLRQSYWYLPSHLKVCFSYCSLFPKGFIFEKETLVHMWIAEGFVRPQETKTSEVQASEYFDYLVSLSFLRHFGSGFVMHDLVHDLAQSISADECLRIENDSFQKMSESFRHVSLFSDNLKWTGYEILYKQKKLRTLLFFHRSKRGLQHIPRDLFLHFKGIRVLDLGYGGIEVLPDSIYCLRHLRYLDLSHNDIGSLEEPLGCLLKLQMLNINGCPKLHKLPRGTSKLVNLRHLKSDPELLPSIRGIGKLTSLQELQKFKVSKRSGNKIVELRDLSEIRGALCIYNLENVASENEARMAMLNKKTHLSALGLEWTPRDDAAKSTNRGRDEEVLECLEPPESVRVLNIRCYVGVKSPSWMEPKVLPNLETVLLQGCQRWEQLPPLGELLGLKLLRIEGLERVTEFDRGFHGQNGFPSLEELQLYDMHELVEWSAAEDHGLFPNLRKLDIRTCPKLMKLPQLPGLTELKLEKVGLVELPDMWPSEAMAASGRSLVKLRIVDCPNLNSLSRSLQPYHLKALEKLSLTGCKELEVLPEGWLGSLQSLKRLTLEDCPKLTPPAHGGCDLPSSLLSLKVAACPGVVNGIFCRNVQSLLLCSSVVRKHYPDLDSCAEEVLQHLTQLHMLNLQSYCDDPSSLLQAEAIQEQVHFSYVVTNELSQHEEILMPSKVDVLVKGPRSLSSATFATVFSSLKFLKSLQISGFRALTSLPQDSLTHQTALRYLTITSCKELVSLTVQPLSSLEQLRVQDCPKLMYISGKQDAATLKVLIVISCTSLQSLPPELELFTSLEYLHIEDCTRMRSLPKLPKSLKDKLIEGCPDLLEE